jgi:large subunit ribosomal protein L9
LRATEENRVYFEKQRVQLEATNLKRREEATAVASKLEGQSPVIIRQAGDMGHLYGSVTARDITEELIAGGFTVTRQQVLLKQNIKLLGIYNCRIALHPEVIVTVPVNVARNKGEAKAQAAGESFVIETGEKPEEETSEEEVEPRAKKKKAKAPKKETEDTGGTGVVGGGEETEEPTESSPAETSKGDQEAEKEGTD